jgi:multisubunit Na+/H+ antiporter MnhB subunit
MQSVTINPRFCIASAPSIPRSFPTLAAHHSRPARGRKRTFGQGFSTTLAVVAVSIALSGCGVFCGGAGGSGGGFAGGCAADVRF